RIGGCTSDSVRTARTAMASGTHQPRLPSHAPTHHRPRFARLLDSCVDAPPPATASRTVAHPSLTRQTRLPRLATLPRAGPAGRIPSGPPTSKLSLPADADASPVSWVTQTLRELFAWRPPSLPSWTHRRAREGSNPAQDPTDRNRFR